MDNQQSRVDIKSCQGFDKELGTCCISDYNCESDCCLKSRSDLYVCKLQSECEAIKLQEEDQSGFSDYLEEQLPLIIGISLPLVLILIIFCCIAIRSYQKRWWAHRRKVKIKAKKKSQLDPRSYDMQRMNASEKMERPEEPNRLEWFFVSQSFSSISEWQRG